MTDYYRGSEDGYLPCDGVRKQAIAGIICPVCRHLVRTYGNGNVAAHNAPRPDR